ncbi:MAG TPA: M28 family metallopeptidase [Planctomycetota bacterium]|jgi:Zn-dependent M28 family amino/carboxypeptidase
MRIHRYQFLLLPLFCFALAHAADAPQPDSLIKDLLGEVSETEIRSTIQALQDFKSRMLGQPGNAAAAEYLHKRFSAIPKLTVDYQDEKLRNVIATLKGSDAVSTAVFMVGAHYDSTSKDPLDAPGATDDAAGCAVVLEFARILSRHAPRHTVKFTCWNGEEAGLKGSFSYADEAAKKKEDIRLYVNCDSIACDPQNRLLLDIVFEKNATDIKDAMVANNDLYGIGFKLQFNQHHCGGDHVPFIRKGYTAIMLHQEDHAHQHSPADTIDKVSTRYTASAARLSLSVLAAQAGAGRAQEK